MNCEEHTTSYKIGDQSVSQRFQQITDAVKRFWSPDDMNEEHNICAQHMRIVVYRYKYKERWSESRIGDEGNGMFIWRRLHTTTNPNPEIWALAVDNQALGR